MQKPNAQEAAAALMYYRTTGWKFIPIKLSIEGHKGPQ